jgi:putative Ca2+/H+ antiporter (TMEM165/GDT1 family)
VLIDPEAPNDPKFLVHEQPVDSAIAQITTQTAEPLQPLAGSNAQFWKIFGSTFITIFLAELGDKTQVATLLMSAQSHAPWSVFTGAAIALITTSLLGVLVGQWLSSRVSPRTLDIAAGITLALLSIAMLWDAVGI